MQLELLPSPATVVGGLELRPLQAALLDRVAVAFREGHKNIMVNAPCGFGKTECATALLIKTKENGKRGAFIADRIQLIQQTSQRFDKYGLGHSVMQAQHPRYDEDEQIQLCSIQTLIKRRWPDAALYVHDEAHVLTLSVRKRLLERKGFSIGLSATPMTKGLGKYFDCIITAATTNDLIGQGLLVPFDIFAPSEPDLNGVRIIAGEYDEKETEQKCLPIVGDVVAEYQKRADGKKFICFAVSVNHAKELQSQFYSAGIIAALYTYREGDAEREETVQEFRRQDSVVRGLISIESLTRGFDVADVEVMICARPLRKALHVFIQMLGRVLRTSPGKDRALLLDHSGNAVRFHAELKDYLQNGVTELDDGSKGEKKKPQKKEKKPMKCHRCSCVHDPRPTCPACGFEYPRREVEKHIAGELHALEMGPAPKISTIDKRQLYAELRWIADARQWSEGRLSNVFRDIVGTWPNAYKGEAAAPPSPQTLNKVKSLTIAFIKSPQGQEWARKTKKIPTP